MKRLVCLASAVMTCAFVPAAFADHDGNGRSCAAKAAGTYGFQCQGSIALAPAAPLEPVTFGGLVTCNQSASCAGYGTLNSSLGSNHVDFAGTATFDDNCFGRVAYTKYDITVPGGTISAAPAYFDFIAVDNSAEVLGVGVAPGSSGNAVPRLACRLVRVRGN
ncbi:MAG TPA: hypothetical protein VGI14_06490 [Casimicrobiaceae bacterium]|jgi:hypothetical protein